MKITEKQKPFFQLYFAVLKSSKNLKHFEKRNESYVFPKLNI